MSVKVSLDQWQTLIAVVENGGYAPAAEVLNKSQSTVSYAISKMETTLNVRLFTLEGRKSVLTPVGKDLYQRARFLTEEAGQMESLAGQYAAGREPELTIAMDTLFPEWMMVKAIRAFCEQSPHTRINLRQTVLSGTDELLINKQADIGISGRIPVSMIGAPLMQIHFVAVAAPDHPLHQLNRTLSLRDLRLYRQLVVSDSGSRNLDAGWLGAQHRLTVSNFQTSIEAAIQGLGFAWIPVLKIQKELESGQLKALDLESGGDRQVQLYLILTNSDYPGPAVSELAAKIQQEARGC